MRILLIGANGQLGSELLTTLRPHGSIVAAVRQPKTMRAECETAFVDLAISESIRTVVQNVRPNLIVNAAAYTAVDSAEQDRDAAMAVNAVGPRVLAKAARESGAVLIHYSTDYVFSGDRQQAWREEDQPAPVNFYGLSKLAGEEAIRSSGVAHLILRCSWLYGKRGANFVKKMFAAASKASEIAMVTDQIGAPTSARFVAKVTAEIITRANGDLGIFNTAEGLVHVACAGEASRFAFAEAIFRQARELELPIALPSLRPTTSASYPSPARRPTNSRFDTSRLRDRFGIEPPQWEAELKDNLPDIHAQYASELRE